jgi:hypothetical protein
MLERSDSLITPLSWLKDFDIIYLDLGLDRYCLKCRWLWDVAPEVDLWVAGGCSFKVLTIVVTSVLKLGFTPDLSRFLRYLTWPRFLTRLHLSAIDCFLWNSWMI